jgi:pimeloyl-ACP methyl ester carboxylesterase
MNFRFRDEGTGPALLLIHGWTLDLDMWEPQVRELHNELRIIRYDRRPSLPDDVTDALALCEHLQLQSVAVLGMSQGARVAAHIAAARPELVSHIIFDGAPAGVVPGQDGESDVPIARYRKLARAGGNFLEEWRKHPLARLHDPRNQELLDRMLARCRASDLLDAPGLPPISIRAPSLIISGALDLQTRLRAADALARCLPGSQRELVPAAGHMPNLDNPQAYNALLRQFLLNTKS